MTLNAQATLQERLDQKSKEFAKNKDPKMIAVRADFKKANDELEKSGIMEKATSVGVKIPDFKVGGRNISELYKEKPLVIKFYRGHWCPYCMVELQEYERLMPEITKRNGHIIGLVPDTKKHISKTKRKFNLTFPIFQDKDNGIAKKLGLAFKLDKKVLKHYKAFGINLNDSQGNKNGELPLPGTYVVDTSGIIKFAFYDANYVKRADPQEVLKVLWKLKN